MTRTYDSIWIDDLHSLRQIEVLDAEVWSTSTGVPYLEKKRSVRSPENLISQPEIDALFLAQKELLTKLRTGVAFPEWDRPESGYAFVQLVALNKLFHLFAYKGFVLSRWLDCTSGQARAIAGSIDLYPSSSTSPIPARHSHIYAAIASRIQEDVHFIPVDSVPEKLFSRISNHIPLVDKVFNLTSRSISAVAYQIWRRQSRPLGRGKRGEMIIPYSNEGIEDAFLGLLKAGWRISNGVFPEQPKDLDACTEIYDKMMGFKDPVVALWTGSISGFVRPNVVAALQELMCESFDRIVNSHLYDYARAHQTVELWHRAARQAPMVVLTNGMFSPYQLLLDRFLRERKLPVVCVDHGTGAGVAEFLENENGYLQNFGDIHAVYNQESLESFERSTAAERLSLKVAGAPPRLSSRRFSQTIRYITKIKHKIPLSSRIAMYVTTLTSNNSILGFGTGSDDEYARYQQGVVSALSAFEGTVLVKAYPVQRYGDPEQIWVMPLPSNAQLCPPGEFRHYRWAADFLIVEATASTLAWAFASERPLLFIENERARLTDRARSSMRRSMFYIDGREPGFEARLAAILRLSAKEIADQWSEMASARAKFNERFLLGPNQDFSSTIRNVVASATLDATQH